MRLLSSRDGKEVQEESQIPQTHAYNPPSQNNNDNQKSTAKTRVVYLFCLSTTCPVLY